MLNFCRLFLDNIVTRFEMIICLRVCKFYARGACLKGDQCAFVHEKKDEDSGHVSCDSF